MDQLQKTAGNCRVDSRYYDVIVRLTPVSILNYLTFSATLRPAFVTRISKTWFASQRYRF